MGGKMLVWVLILVLTTPSGVALHSVEYSSLEACVAAGQNYQAATANDGWQSSFSCNQK